MAQTSKQIKVGDVLTVDPLYPREDVIEKLEIVITTKGGSKLSIVVKEVNYNEGGERA
jgi:hypothetical protein